MPTSRSALACVLASAFALLGCVSFPSAPVSTRQPVIEECAFIAGDGARLGLTQWRAENAIAIIAAVHGMNDYAGAFALAAPIWSARGISTFAYDQRGFGRSPQAGRWAGGPAMKQDLGSFVSALRREHPSTPIFVLGHSMGAAVVMAALKDQSLDADGVILAAPGVWGGAQMPLFYRATLNAAATLAPGKALTGESAGRQASDNIEFLRAMYHDPHVIKETRLDAVLGVVRMMGEGWDASNDIAGNFLVVYGDRDDIIPVKKMKKAAARLAGDIDVRAYPSGWHLLLADHGRQAPISDIADWVSERARANRADRKPPLLSED